MSRKGESPGREGWDAGRQLRESQLRQYLASMGTHLPRQCPDCPSPLEVFRDTGGAITARCTGSCGRADRRVAFQQMQSTGAAPLPGFE